MEPLRPLAIYVHWPWCKVKCPYCDFNSHAGEVYEQAYIEGLVRELERWASPFALADGKTSLYSPATRRIESVFFGGGTPSLMAPENIAKVLDSCRKLGVFDRDTEVTVECNPTSFDEGREPVGFFRDLKAAGVNRISVGIQGLKPEWLAFLGRKHRVEDALATLDAAQAVFSNVNADVIYGLPGQALEDWVKQLERLAERGLAHISAYQLTIEKNTRFYNDVKRGLWEPIPDELEADFFEATRAVLTGRGYDNYEISNFARPGLACRHNTHVWQYGEYLGIGAGAHGRIDLVDGTRVATQVVRQPEGYLRRINGLEDTFAQVIPLDALEIAQEALFSGLRLATGVDEGVLIKRIGEAAYKEAILERETAHLVATGFLVRDNHTLKLSDRGWARLNSVLTRILRVLPERDVAATTPTPSSSSAYNQRQTVVIE
jgi:oxygen-independent coproporphyrinogen-3 oxidase